jgi:NADPH:quinone reductase-like Zn-dependent oxidoreductase
MAGDKCVRGFWLGDWAKRQGVLTMLRLIRRIRGLMREGVLTTEVAAEYPLDRVVDAVRHAASPARGGKVLLRIG